MHGFSVLQTFNPGNVPAFWLMLRKQASIINAIFITTLCQPCYKILVGTFHNITEHSPQQGPGAKPPWSWSIFSFCTFNGSHKIAHFSKLWKEKDIRYLCYLCKKSWVGTKLGGDGAKLGGLCSPSPSLGL